MVQTISMPEAKRSLAPVYGASAESVVVLVTRGTELTEVLMGLCRFLRIRVVCLRPGMPIANTLHTHRPMAVLCESDAINEELELEAEVAACDPGLPVLLVQNDEEPTPTPLSARHTTIVRYDCLPELLNFLFLAGRRNGTGRMMPV